MFLLIAIIIKFVAKINLGSRQYDQNIFLIVSIVVTLICIAVSYFLFNKKIQNISADAELGTRLNDYRTAFIQRCALLEAPCLLSIILFLLTGNFIIISIAILLLVIFLTNFPSTDKVANTLQLTDEERSLL